MFIEDAMNTSWEAPGGVYTKGLAYHFSLGPYAFFQRIPKLEDPTMDGSIL